MAAKERHATRAGQAPAWPGPAKDPAWAGLAPEPAQAGPAQGRAGDSGGLAAARRGRGRAPVWRALLEAQWRDRVQEVTELSLAYHEAASAAIVAPAGTAPAGGPAERQVRKLLRRTVTARRALTDTEEALSRLTSGQYGRCEGCAATIPERLLAAVPDTRYCPRCRPRPVRAPGPTLAARPALR
jgi:RNA polymerase-binding transcription factor DksA